VAEMLHAQQQGLSPPSSLPGTISNTVGVSSTHALQVAQNVGHEAMDTCKTFRSGKHLLGRLHVPHVAPCVTCATITDTGTRMPPIQARPLMIVRSNVIWSNTADPPCVRIQRGRHSRQSRRATGHDCGPRRCAGTSGPATLFHDHCIVLRYFSTLWLSCAAATC